jgi:hypothetical protein
VKIPTALLEATRSRFWRTTPAPPVRMAQTAADDVDVLEEPRASAGAPSLSEPLPAPQRPASAGDVLLSRLDSCSDDAQRAALLAAASVEAREQLPAALSYRTMSTLAGRNPRLGALVAALDSAADESARGALLAVTSPALLVELAEHLRHDRCEAVAQRYMDMLEQR